MCLDFNRKRQIGNCSFRNLESTYRRLAADVCVCKSSDHEVVPLGCKQTDSCIQLADMEAEYGPVMKKGTISDPTDAVLTSV